MSNVPKLRFKEFSEEWAEKKLLSLSENGFSNGAFNDPKKVGSGYKIINVKDMYIDGTINTNSLTKVALDEKEFLKNRVEYGDIFFTRSSLVKEGIAYSNINLSNDEDLTFDGHLIRMRPKKEICSPIFLYYNFKTQRVRNQFIVRGKTTTMTTIGQDDISSVNISLPSKQEQEKIALFLTSVDTKIEQLTKKEQLLQQYKKSVMQKIFNQEIRFKDDDGSEFCDWEEKKLDDVLKTVSTKLYQIKNSDILSEGLFKVVDQGQKTIAGYSNDTEKVYSSGDIIVYGDHTTIVKYIDFDFIVGADGTKLLNTTKDNNLKYMYYNLVFNNIEAEGYKRHFSILRNITLQIPSLKEQIKIANFLSSIDSKIEQVQKQLNFTKEFKKALLQKMFI